MRKNDIINIIINREKKQMINSIYSISSNRYKLILFNKINVRCFEITLCIIQRVSVYLGCESTV